MTPNDNGRSAAVIVWLLLADVVLAVLVAGLLCGALRAAGGG